MSCFLLSFVLGISAGALISDERILPKKHTDEMVSSAECASDDEDQEECGTSKAGGTGQFAFACFLCAFTHLQQSITVSLKHHTPMVKKV